MAFRVKKLLKDTNFFKLRGNIRFIEVSFSHFFLFNLTISQRFPSITENPFCYSESGSDVE